MYKKFNKWMEVQKRLLCNQYSRLGGCLQWTNRRKLRADRAQLRRKKLIGNFILHYGSGAEAYEYLDGKLRRVI